MKFYYYNNIPEPIVALGNNRYYVYMNVHEVEVVVTKEDGEGSDSDNEEQQVVIRYNGDYIKVNGIPTYPGVVNSLIREKYTESDELAIQRQRYNKPASFDEYNEYCEWCKSIARPVFFPEKPEEGGE